jgi:RsiW-degrading membrane proteinase PrsW (M82 family)
MQATLHRKVSPGWHKDPFGAAELRWWDGAAWTEYVSSAGVVASSPAQVTAPTIPTDLPQVPSAPQAPSAPEAQASPFGHGAPPAQTLPGAGWYREGMRADVERWWDGSRWTNQYRKFVPRAGALPQWLSVPVVIALPLAILYLLGLALLGPFAWLMAVAFGAVVAVPLIGTFVWLDRLEPEPWPERIHALLWGASVAVVLALAVNSLVGWALGPAAAAVLSAPFIEELGKGLGVLFILRRARIDSMMDGVVYAGWIGAGFALIEDVGYAVVTFAETGSYALALGVAFMRGVLTMFAHSLMTMPIGLAVGWAVTRGRNPYAAAALGWLPAMILHGLWNGATFAEGVAGPVAVMLFMVLLFLVSAATLVVARLNGRAALARQVPRIAAHYGLTAQEAAAFSSWEAKLRIRRSLPRSQRPAFDRMHAAVSRLAAVQEWTVPPSAEYKQRVVEGLWEARAAV